MDFPAHFVRNLRTAFGSKADAWLLELPNLLARAFEKWDLEPGTRMPLSYNYVISAVQSGGIPVVLKAGVPNPEFTSERTSLRIFDGDGCVRLLEYDQELNILLLERLTPGVMLADQADDEAAAHIACQVMRRLWRSAPVNAPLINLTDWFTELKNVRLKFDGTTGPFPRKLFEKVESDLPALFSSSTPACLIHGDFHHFNILSSERGWLAIDPKGVIGNPEYDCAPFLMNPMPGFAYQPDAVSITSRRIAIMSEQLGFSREIIRDWGLCHAILSGYWDLTENGTGTDYAIACAAVIQNAEI
ncbi:MAG: aminoglycoside phosphotransferase family protein [Chloroflexota bacterium]